MYNLGVWWECWTTPSWRPEVGVSILTYVFGCKNGRSQTRWRLSKLRFYWALICLSLVLKPLKAFQLDFNWLGRIGKVQRRFSTHQQLRGAMSRSGSGRKEVDLYVSKAIHGSLAFLSKALTVCTARSASQLDWGYLGLLVTWVKPYASKNFRNTKAEKLRTIICN